MRISRAINAAIALPIRVWRYVFSPMAPASCRFYPTCSQYALDALDTKPSHRALYLIARRVLRCHPWGGEGFDPVPTTTPHRAP